MISAQRCKRDINSMILNSQPYCCSLRQVVGHFNRVLVRLLDADIRHLGLGLDRPNSKKSKNQNKMGNNGG